MILNGCGGGGGATQNPITPDQVKATMNEIYLRWEDAYVLALYTPAISLAPVIANMQSIKREVDALSVPACLSNSKQVLMDGMNAVIDSFLGKISTFGGGSALLKIYESVIAAACSSTPVAVSTLTLSAPFTGIAGLVSKPAHVAPVPSISPYYTYYIPYWQSANEIVYLKYFSDPVGGDVIDFYITDISNTSPIAIFAGPNVRYCNVKYHVPAICSSWGITVSRAAGTISFANTPITEMTDGTTATGRTGTLNGTLNFAPF